MVDLKVGCYSGRVTGLEYLETGKADLIVTLLDGREVVIRLKPESVTVREEGTDA